MLNTQQGVSAAQLGLNNVALDAEKISAWIPIAGRTDITVLYEHTRNGASELQFVIETGDNPNLQVPKIYPWMGGSVAQTATQTVETLKPYVVKRPVTASENGRFTLKVNDPHMRIRVTSTGGNANDKITVQLVLGAQTA